MTLYIPIAYNGGTRFLSTCMIINLHGSLSQADIDNSGSIDYGEFLAATLHLNKMDREENLIAAFSFFDKDASGYITIDELQQACKEFGLGDVQLDDMIKDIDQDNVSVFCSLATQLRYLQFRFLISTFDIIAVIIFRLITIAIIIK